MCEYVALWLYVISCAEGISCAPMGRRIKSVQLRRPASSRPAYNNLTESGAGFLKIYQVSKLIPLEREGGSCGVDFPRLQKAQAQFESRVTALIDKGIRHYNADGTSDLTKVSSVLQ